MDSTENQQEITPKGALVRHPNDHLPHWRDSIELFWRCEDIVFSPCFTLPVITNTPSPLAHPIPWCLPDEGITLVELFGGIGIEVVAMLEASLTIR